VHSFYGNFGVILKAYAYLLQLGDEGLREVSENAVLNANYLQERLKRTYRLPYDRLCKHEFVLSGEGMGEGISTLDIAKRLIDYGFHPPTVYFPLIVHEALMIEPTECEGKETRRQGRIPGSSTRRRRARRCAGSIRHMLHATRSLPTRSRSNEKTVERRLCVVSSG